MKKANLYFCFLFAYSFLFSGCYLVYTSFEEIRTGLIGTNIIGIVGPTSSKPYIEIIYSYADPENSGQNRTRSRWVTLPYVFQNNNVYMTYLYFESSTSSGGGPSGFGRILLRDFEEGGAEYFRIINHSPDKTVEFFIAGAPSIFHENFVPRPAITYNNVAIYHLLFPEHNHPANPGGRRWKLHEVLALYHAEQRRCPNVRLMVLHTDRMIDLQEGRVPGSAIFRGSIFNGIIEPGKALQGNENIWLLATPSRMFNTLFYMWVLSR
jgi:hypothetical protein